MDERPEDYVPPASGLERRFADLVRRAGGEPMDRQVNVSGDRWLGRVDFKDRTLPLIVEIDSERYHLALVDRRADSARDAAMHAAGYVVLRFWDNQVWYEGDAVVHEVRHARRELRLGLAA